LDIQSIQENERKFAKPYFKGFFQFTIGIIENHFPLEKGAIVAVIVWWLDLQLPMQSVPIATDVVSSNLDQCEVYSIM
jgi:hypothetical protein